METLGDLADKLILYYNAKVNRQPEPGQGCILEIVSMSDTFTSSVTKQSFKLIIFYFIMTQNIVSKFLGRCLSYLNLTSDYTSLYIVASYKSLFIKAFFFLIFKIKTHLFQKASKDHVVLDLVATKIPSERLDGRLTGHNLSTWNIKVSNILMFFHNIFLVI